MRNLHSGKDPSPDLLARNRRYADAQAMLQDALRQDPQNVAPMVSLGLLERVAQSG